MTQRLSCSVQKVFAEILEFHAISAKCKKINDNCVEFDYLRQKDFLIYFK